MLVAIRCTYTRTAELRLVSPVILGAAASFFSGVAVALLASYPIPQNSIFVCFVAIAFGLVACLLAAWAVVLACTRRERVRVERVIDLTVEQMLRRRGLELVDD